MGRGNSQINLLAFERCSYFFFFFFPSLLSRGLCDNIHQNHRIILAGNNEISVKFSKLKSAICDEIT